MTTSVVYIHGAGNKPPPDELKREWDRDLFGGDMGDRTRMAYYADLLHDRPSVIGPDACTQEQLLAALAGEALAAVVPTPAATPASAATVPASTAVQASAAATPASADMARLTDQGRRFALSLSITMIAHAATTPALLHETPIALHQLPAPQRRLLLRQLVERFIPDADSYFFTDRSEPIRQRLREVLDSVDGPVLVVGHGLGTVVAYDVLSEARFATLAVPVLVTLGSPLGYPEIQEMITKPPRVPVPVRMWANFADPFDVVALDATLSGDFNAASRIIDTRVANPSPNHHASCGYLRGSQVRAVVNAMVGEPA